MIEVATRPPPGLRYVGAEELHGDVNTSKLRMLVQVLEYVIQQYSTSSSELTLLLTAVLYIRIR